MAGKQTPSAFKTLLVSALLTPIGQSKSHDGAPRKWALQNILPPVVVVKTWTWVQSSYHLCCVKSQGLKNYSHTYLSYYRTVHSPRIALDGVHLVPPFHTSTSVMFFWDSSQPGLEGVGRKGVVVVASLLVFPCGEVSPGLVLALYPLSFDHRPGCPGKSHPRRLTYRRKALCFWAADLGLLGHRLP